MIMIIFKYKRLLYLTIDNILLTYYPFLADINLLTYFVKFEAFSKIP